MKALKGFFLSGIIFVLALLLVFLQVHMSVNRTFISSSYFNSSFDENNVSVAIKDMIYYKISNISLTSDDFRDNPSEDSSQSFLPTINVGEKILEYIDEDWLEVQVSNIVKETHSYLMSGSNALPTIDISSIKENLLDGLVDEILQREEVQDNVIIINELLPILSNEYASEILNDNLDKELIDKIMNLDLIRDSNLDRQSVEIILNVYMENNEAEIANIEKEIVTRIFITKFNFDEIEDELDLNEALKRVFPNNDDPLTSFRTFITSYKSIISTILLALILMLVAIIFLINFNIYSSLNWLASGSIIAGLTGLVFGLLGFFPLITKALYYNILSLINIADKIESISNIQNWIEGCINKFFTTLIIQGSILIVLSIIVFVIVAVLSRYNSKVDYAENEDEIDNSNVKAVGITKSKSFIIIISTMRVIAVLILLTLIPLTIKWGTQDFVTSLNEFTSALESNSGTLENIDFTELIPEMIIRK